MIKSRFVQALGFVDKEEHKYNTPACVIRIRSTDAQQFTRGDFGRR